MKLENFDHTFLEVGRLGSGLDGLLIGGDQSTWGEGAVSLGEFHCFEPTLGNDGKSLLVVNGVTLDMEDMEIDDDKLTEFVKNNFPSELSETELDFILYMITGTYFGDKNGEISGFDIDEWPIENIQKTFGEDLAGKLLLHQNVRYNSSTSIGEKGEINWLDDVNPDDDAQRVAISN